MSRIVTMNNWLRQRVRVALGIQAEFPGDVDPGFKNVILAEDLTEHRQRYPRGVYSWEVSDDANPNASDFPAMLFGRRGLTDPRIRRLCRITSMAVWSTGSSPVTVGWKVLNQGAVPVMLVPNTVLPFPRDGRQGTQQPLWQLTTGSNGDGPAYGSGTWARMPAPTVVGGTGNTVVRFDPQITLRYGDFLYLASDQLGFNWGLSLAFEDWPCTDEEWSGQNTNFV